MYENNSIDWMKVARTHREDMKISIGFMSEYTTIHRTLISRYESGERQIKLGEFLAYLDAMGLIMKIEI